MDGVLELAGLNRRFGALTALDDLSFPVSAGQVCGFLGPNGAGKTTNMRAIFGLVELDAGTVTWNGSAVDHSDRRRFGYMPEERGLYASMMIGEQLAADIYRRAILRTGGRVRLRDLLAA